MSLGVMTMHKQNNWLWFVEYWKISALYHLGMSVIIVSYSLQPSIQKSRVVFDVFNILTLFIYLFFNIEFFYFHFLGLSRGFIEQQTA